MSWSNERLRRWLREPLVRFAIAGAALFGLHRAVTRPPQSNRLVISAAFVEGLRQDAQRRNGRPPTAEELRGLLERTLDEEVQVREALALGLDRGDVIVRRRLMEKMEVVSDEDDAAGGSAAEPDTAELGRFLDAHAERYALPARTSFEQIFVGGANDPAVEARAAELLAKVKGGADPERLGAPFLLGRRFVLRSEAQIAAELGPAFARQIAAIPVGDWVGPLRSSYGAHLVRVTARAAAAPPPLPVILPALKSDWLAERRAQRRRAALDALRRRYPVEIEPEAAQRLAAPAATATGAPPTSAATAAGESRP